MAEFRDFLVQIDWETNLKVRKIRARFGAAGQLCLIRLWAYTAGNAPDGFLGPMTPEELGIACGADLEGIDPAEFGAALLAGKRPLVETAPSSLVVRDWLEHQPTIKAHLAKSRAGKEGARARWGDGTSMADSEVPSGCHDGRTMADQKCHSGSESGHNASFLPSCPPAFPPERHAPASPPPSPPGNLSLAPNPGKQPEPEGPIETQAQELVAAFQAVAKRRGPPLQVPPVNMATLRIAEQALADPVTRATWRDALMTLDQQGPPDWWGRSRPGGELDAGMKLGLQAFLKPANFARFASGEFTGSKPPDRFAGMTPLQRQKILDAEAAEADAALDRRLREEDRAKREAKAAANKPGS